MASKTVVEQLIIEIAGDGRKFTKARKAIQKDARGMEGDLKKLSVAGAAAFAALGASAAALGVHAAKSFMDFETGITNVAKTTNLAGKDLDDFKTDIMDMSEEIPVTTDKLLEIATAAGQLGIKGADNLSKFTETIAKLGATTDVEGNDAALAIARILNLTNESIDSVDKLGSTLVDLGNNFAASESEILEVSKDVAKATVLFKLSSDEILGISAAMASLGIAAEAGGTVVGKAFQSIDEAIRAKAGPAFDKLIELTGMTGEQLTKTFETDAALVFTSFVDGLGKAANAGKSTTEELAALGLSGIRVNKILPTLASRSDILAEAMKRAGIASKDASALNEEAAKAFDTSANRIIQAQNKINNAFIVAGEAIAQGAAEGLTSAAASIEENQGLWNTLGLIMGEFVKVVAKDLGIVSTIIGSMKDAAVTDIGILASLFTGQIWNDIFAPAKKATKAYVDSWRKSQDERTAATKRANDQIVENQKEADLKLKKLAQKKDKDFIKLEKARIARKVALNRQELKILELQQEGADSEEIQREQDKFDKLMEINRLAGEILLLGKAGEQDVEARIAIDHKNKILAIKKQQYAQLLLDQEDAQNITLAETKDFIESLQGVIDDDPVVVPVTVGTDGNGVGTTGGGGGTTTGGTTTGGTTPPTVEEDPQELVAGKGETKIDDNTYLARAGIKSNQSTTLGCSGNTFRSDDQNGTAWCVEACRSGFQYDQTTLRTCRRKSTSSTTTTSNDGNKEDEGSGLTEAAEEVVDEIIKGLVPVVIDIGGLFGSASSPNPQSSGLDDSSSTSGGFAQTSTQGGGGAPQKVIVELELKDELVNFVSAKQRENDNLGVPKT